MIIAEMIGMPFVIEKDYFYEAKSKWEELWFKIPEYEISLYKKYFYEIRKSFTERKVFKSFYEMELEKINI